MMFLSVVIPTFNRKESLLHTLGALEKQTLPATDFEVIIVSDGSTDGTAEAIHAREFPFRLRFLEQSNSGPSVARNYGARAACGEVIVYLDDDIEPIPVFLETHAKAQKVDPKLVLIGPQSMPKGERFPIWIAWEHRMLEKQYARFRSGEWQAGPNNLYSGNFSVRRKDLIEVGGFDVSFKRQEDVELGFRLAAHGLHFLFDGDADGYHRPVRTYDSWYNTPYLYGVRDVEMARDKGQEQAFELARKHFGERSRLTRTLARIFIGKPMLESLLFGILRPAPLVLDKIGLRKPALGICSLLFNLRYLQGMATEIGGARQMWQMMAVKA